MGLSASTAVFLASLTGIPIAYMLNLMAASLDEKYVFAAGVISLIAIVVLTYVLADNKKKLSDPLFYVFSICCFSSVCDLFLSLENDGWVTGIMEFYLKDGEPYLASSMGILACYWDGIGHYAMYLIMLWAMDRNQDFRDCGLYWVGSIGHSLFVFLPGNVIGKYGVKWSFLLNVPYVIVPIYALARFLNERPKATIPKKQSQTEYSPIWKRPVDMLLILYLAASLVLAMFRGFTVLGCNPWYIRDVEPYLTDPTSYPMLQMLVYMFYFIPYYCMAMYGLVVPGCSWMPDWAMVHAGAAIQAQISHIGSAIHDRTPYIHRIPMTFDSMLPFLAINLPLLIIPQLMAARCLMSSEYFMPVEEKSNDSLKPSQKRETKKIK
ncbi:transmembrane 6 superfamily member 1-like isoform X2 [Lineus longissimus]|uniref:transmembrane 6 superfamily member 1-like isoform X2 n=1 Tax=Lineus longissimus TaxID=88925 RepID=UPI002B4F075D